MAREDFSYVGKGEIHIRQRGAPEGLMPFGNCSGLELAIETNRISQPDFRSPGGGEANAIDRITSVSLTVVALELSGLVLSVAMRGTSLDVAGGTTVTGERYTAYQGALIAFRELPDLTDPANTLTVTIDPAGTPTVATLDTDYTVTRAGVKIIKGGGIADGDTVDVAYTKAAQNIVQALVASAREFELVLNGLNEAQSGKAVMIRVHRIKFSPTSGLQLIGDEFAEASIEGSALIDTGVVGTGLSQYMEIAQED